MKKHVVVIGGGAAGAEASVNLANLGLEVTLVEKTGRLGGMVAQWDRLFPTKRKATEILDFLEENVRRSGTRVIFNSEVTGIIKENGHFAVKAGEYETIKADAILVATGYEVFNARVKEEYGYGIYDNVITSVELEEKFRQNEKILTTKGIPPRRIGFVHCVGSRDEKVGNNYCSQVCCVTAVKQASEIKEALPQAEVFCFYMDLRMFGLHFEDLYKDSQLRLGVNYIRGRVSEASENIDGSIVVKVEDTLSGRPLKMKVDLLVLMVGFVPSAGTRKISSMLNLELTPESFIKPLDEHTHNHASSVAGIFITGTCKSPKTIADTFADARAAAIKINEYLQKTGETDNIGL